MFRAFRSACLSGIAALYVMLPVSVQADRVAISGSVDASAESRRAIAATDRLVIKIYHPKNGVEMDATYRILPTFTLPQAFSISPSLDMNRQAKWPSYRVDIYTDKDGDVLSLSDGEVFATSSSLVDLGHRGLVLTLQTPD